MWKSKMRIERPSCQKNYKSVNSKAKQTSSWCKKHKKTSKRKSKACMAATDVFAEGLDSEIPTIKHVIEVEPPKPVSKSRNKEASPRV